MAWNNDLLKKGSILQRRSQHFNRRIRVIRFKMGVKSNQLHGSRGRPPRQRIRTSKRWQSNAQQRSDARLPPGQPLSSREVDRLYSWTTDQRPPQHNLQLWINGNQTPPD